MTLDLHARRALIGAAAGALGLGLASAALAQSGSDRPGYNEAGPVEGVTVTPYRHGHPAHDVRSGIGGPIEEQPVTADASRYVDFSDLDLRSDRDARVLRVRIERAAHSACGELAAQPGGQDQDGAFCYADAVRDGLQQAAYQVGYRPPGW